MKLGYVTSSRINNGTNAVYKIRETRKTKPQMSTSIKKEVAVRRKKQKTLRIIDNIKKNIENKINEKIKDILGIRF